MAVRGHRAEGIANQADRPPGALPRANTRAKLAALLGVAPAVLFAEYAAKVAEARTKLEPARREQIRDAVTDFGTAAPLPRGTAYAPRGVGEHPGLLAALSARERQAMGRRLSAARQVAGYSAEGLAQALGYRSASAVWPWERGRLPRARAREKLAALLGVEEAVLFAELLAKHSAKVAEEEARRARARAWTIAVMYYKPRRRRRSG